MRKLALDEGELRTLFGVYDDNLQTIESELGIQISARDREVFLEGEERPVEVATKVLTELGRMVARGYTLKPSDVRTAVRIATESPSVSLERFFADNEIQTASSRVVRPQGANQKLYVEAVRSHDMVFAAGPAGTGKTFLAMAMAIEAFNRGAVRRIILARPAIEAGEKLGFLPGDMYEKVNPYLRPLYDALYALVDTQRADRLLERDQIEIAPIAFMRGRTLSDSFVILDEAQNTTSEQMKMFLTRIGMNSKAIINGDDTQVDLPAGKLSGLIQAQGLLRGIEGIAMVRFDEGDVVRHPLVKKIVVAYEQVSRAAADAMNAMGSDSGTTEDEPID